MNPYKLIPDLNLVIDIEPNLLNKNIKTNIFNKLQETYNNKVYKNKYIQEIINIDNNYENKIPTENPNGIVRYNVYATAIICEIFPDMIIYMKKSNIDKTSNIQTVFFDNGCIHGTVSPNINITKFLNKSDYFKVKIMSMTPIDNILFATIEILETTTKQVFEDNNKYQNKTVNL